MPASVQSPPTLRQFGKYFLDEEIARGGMARVYLARLRGLGGFEKKLVVKQVLPELARDPRFVEMFVEEAKTLVQMSHPHIVPVYELGIVDGVYFLAMEYVEGATLAEMLREGPLLPTLVAHLGMEVCEALSYAHERFELVHRDVTPRNVIVDARGHVRLLDFGIAAKTEGALEGEVFGSHGYMSPEQARGDAVDLRSDLFSLGTVLYEALTNQPAFLRRTTEQTKTALLEGDAPSLAGHEAVPEELSSILDACLQRRAEDRPESARAVGKLLRGYLAADAPEGVAPELGERAEASMELRRKQPSHRPPSMDGPTNPDGSVRTIATSVTLRRILGGADTDPDGTSGTVPLVDDVTDPHVNEDAMTGRIVDTQDRTMPIPGRHSNPNVAEESSVPKSPREVRAPVDSLAPTDPRGGPETAPTNDGSSRRLFTWLAVTAAVFTGIVGLWMMSEPEGSDAHARSDAGAVAETAGGTDTVAIAETAADAGTSAETAADAGTGAETATFADAPSNTETETETVSSTDPTPSVTPATLTLVIEPWGDARLGRRVLDTNARQHVVPPGRHVLSIRNPNLQENNQWIVDSFTARSGASYVATVNLDEPAPEIQITER